MRPLVDVFVSAIRGAEKRGKAINAQCLRVPWIRVLATVNTSGEATMFNSIKDTTKHVYWNSHDKCYVALMSEHPMCRAEGATPAEAMANVDRAYAQDTFPSAPMRPRTPTASRAIVYATTH